MPRLSFLHALYVHNIAIMWNRISISLPLSNTTFRILYIRVLQSSTIYTTGVIRSIYQEKLFFDVDMS